MMKSKRYLVAIAASVVVLIVAAAFNKAEANDSWRMIGVRNIGHHLLKYSGDDSTRVPAVVKVADDRYQIRFEKPLAYRTDSLIAIASRESAAGRFPEHYTVTMSDCDTGEQAYAFGQPFVGQSQPACAGRQQPLGCYVLEVGFKPAADGIPAAVYAGIIPAVFLLLLLSKPAGRRDAFCDTTSNALITIGNYRYDPATQSLSIGNSKTTLTAKESRVLEIFANHQNLVVPRETLQKEVWENEGVIVGRSLDVFISKLRKKLEADPRIKITSAHGKGYKLSVESASTPL